MGNGEAGMVAAFGPPFTKFYATCRAQMPKKAAAGSELKASEALHAITNTRSTKEFTRRGGESVGQMFGIASYFGENASKTDKYTAFSEAFKKLLHSLAWGVPNLLGRMVRLSRDPLMLMTSLSMLSQC